MKENPSIIASHLQQQQSQDDDEEDGNLWRKMIKTFLPTHKYQVVSNDNNEAAALESRGNEEEEEEQISNGIELTEMSDGNDSLRHGEIDDADEIISMSNATEDETYLTIFKQNLQCCHWRALCTIIFLLFTIVTILAFSSTRSLLSRYFVPKHNTTLIPVCPKNKSNLRLISSLAHINFNRNVRPLSQVFLFQKLNGAHYGFLWDEGDGNTAKWRPQGITSFQWSSLGGIEYSKTFHFLVVTWYGRSDEGYDNRGVRISLVDITDITIAAARPKVQQQNHTPFDELKLNYRHILLVDENFCTFPHMHAGGVAYHNGKIHVPDSRRGHNAIHVFDIVTSIFEVVSSSSSLQNKSASLIQEEEDFFHYRYVLPKEYTYDVPIKPSFLSYDSDRDLFLVGTYAYCGGHLMQHSDSEKCRRKDLNHLAWYKLGDGVSNLAPSLCGPFFSEMQGAASGLCSLGSNSTEKGILLVSSSYGHVWSSHLHSLSFDPNECKDYESYLDEGEDAFGNYRVFTYPPGLEDIHIEPKSSYHNPDMIRDVWMLTEFGDRMVFATQLDKLLPN